MENNKTITLKELVAGVETINIIGNSKLPVLTSFVISVFLKKVAPIMESFEVERTKLIKEFGTTVKDEDGKDTDNYTFSPENAKAFNEKINELLEAETGVESPQIKLEDLSGLEIEPNKIVSIDWMIKQ